MSSPSVEPGSNGVIRRASAVRSAVVDLFDQEFSWSNGHWTAVLNGCVFAPSILTYWFVNGVVDFSTAIVLGTTATPGGLQARLLAYVLAVPAFLLLRMGYYVTHPVYRETVLAGACPESELLSLDWFTVGIMMTGLPLAFRDLGPWLGMNVVMVVGIFLAPRVTSDERRSLWLKLASILLGIGIFLYANYGGTVAARSPVVPDPALVLGPVATLQLPMATVDLLLRVLNSAVLGPPTVAVLGFLANRILTHPAVAEIPLLAHALPNRDPWRIVVTSAMTGTLFYLGFVAAFTGHLVVIP